MSIRSFAQLPPNIGFEDGSFNHWNCAIGSVTADNQTATSTITLNPSAPVDGRHTLFSKQNAAEKLDYYGYFPVVCPNGSNYSIRLGNDEAHAQAESVSYTFFVASDSPLGYAITFNYAVVLQNPVHKNYEQPRFTARIYDVSAQKYADCPAFDFVAGTALPGFKLSPRNLTDSDGTSAPVFYKDWSSATFDLTPYIGKIIRLEFTTNDCTFQKHFGYAYLDIDEGKSSKPITGNAYCEGAQSVTLKGPIGFAAYQWYNKDLTQLLGTARDLEIYPPPPDLSEFALKITPYPDLGCPDVLYTVVNKINSPYKLNLVPSITGCPETGVDLTAPSVTEGSTPGLIYNYFTDASETVNIRDPKKIVLPGTYFIQGLSPDGCSNTKSIQVKLISPVINVNQPAPVTYPATVDITKAFEAQSGESYGYFSDASCTVPLINYTAINKTGTYFIKVTNESGCELITSVDVKVLPPPPYVVTAPNVFTPNGDGVNDYFALHIEGLVQFNNINIFNRYGQLVYTAKSRAGLWDGNLNGHALPAGAYYWIFDGMDTYYHAPIKKSGSISIIR
nr:gliding motility-associated C-terminal domain-containing protein [Mucilaginibacter sp. UR6-11]